MKRIIILVLLICLMLPTGCAMRRDSGEAEGEYSLSWQELRDNGYLLTFGDDTPAGYAWTGEANGAVTVTGPEAGKKGGITYKVSPAEIGAETVTFTLSADDESGFDLYAYELTFVIDQQGKMTFGGYTARKPGSFATLGEGIYAIDSLTQADKLTLRIEDALWNIRSTNPYFLVSSNVVNGKTLITVYREEDSFVISRSVEDSSVDMDAFYAEKDTELTVECIDADTTYTLYLHMDTEGKVTVTDYTCTAYQGDSVTDGVQVEYNSVTGETRIVDPDSSPSWRSVLNVDTEPTVTEKLEALHAAQYLTVFMVYGMTTEEARGLTLDTFMPFDIEAQNENASREEAEQIVELIRSMTQEELDEMIRYIGEYGREVDLTVRESEDAE